MRVALDATYSAGPALSGVGVSSSRLIEELLRAAPESQFVLCYRANRFFRALATPRSAPNARRRLLEEPLNVLLPRRVDLFHGLNQRLPQYRFRRTVVTFHDLFVITGEYSTPEFRRRFTALAKDAAARADHITAISAYTADQVETLLGVERARITVVRHGVDPLPEFGAEDLAAFRRRHRLERPFALHVGAVQTRKNIIRLVEAFESLVSPVADARPHANRQTGAVSPSPEVGPLAGRHAGAVSAAPGTRPPAQPPADAVSPGAKPREGWRAGTFSPFSGVTPQAERGAGAVSPSTDTRPQAERGLGARELDLVLAGSDGYGAAEIHARIDASPARGRIHTLGYLPRPAIDRLYRTATVLAFPSLDEGFGLPVLEAFAAGLPVVTSNRSALAEVAGDAALLADPADSAAIGCALRRAVEDDALRAEIIRKGRERAAQFRWSHAAAETLAVYRKLL